MGHQALFAAHGHAMGHKSYAVGAPSPGQRSPQAVMHRCLNVDSFGAIEHDRFEINNQFIFLARKCCKTLTTTSVAPRRCGEPGTHIA